MLLKKILTQIGLTNKLNKRCMGNFIIPGDVAMLEELQQSPKKKIFYFTASWCPPCKKIAPIFEKLSRDHTTISFVKIDIDDFPAIASNFGVKSVPTFFFLSGKKTISEVIQQSSLYSSCPIRITSLDRTIYRTSIDRFKTLSEYLKASTKDDVLIKIVNDYRN